MSVATTVLLALLGVAHAEDARPSDDAPGVFTFDAPSPSPQVLEEAMPCLNECSDSPMCTATLMGDGAPVSISCGTQDELAAAIESVAGRPCSEPCKQCMAETMRSLCGSLGGLASSFASSFSSDTPDEGDLGGTAT